MYEIYTIQNKINGKQYIGLTTKSFEVRWKWHLRAVSSGVKNHFYNAIRKHGVDAFEWAGSMQLGAHLQSEEALKQLEIIRIRIAKERGRKLYNSTEGGDGCLNPAPAVRKKLAANGKINGKINGPIQGRKNVENGHLASIRTPENCAKGGKIAGKIAVDSGQLASVAAQGGKIGGKISGKINGPIQGRKNVESGQWASIQSMGGKISGKINGPIQGRKNIESGLMASLQTFENKSKGGRTVTHNRYHRDRGISKPDMCSLCKQAIAS